MNALYAVLQRLFEQPRHPRLETKDMLSLLEVLKLVFVRKRQLSTELVNAFVKRLAILQMNLQPNQQAAFLFLIKQIVNKYPSARSQMLEIEDDTVGAGFGVTPSQTLYRPELNDPQVSNAGQTHAIFEL